MLTERGVDKPWFHANIICTCHLNVRSGVLRAWLCALDLHDLHPSLTNFWPLNAKQINVLCNNLQKWKGKPKMQRCWFWCTSHTMGHRQKKKLTQLWLLVPANRAGPVRPESSSLFLLTSPGHNSNNQTWVKLFSANSLLAHKKEPPITIHW